MTCWRYRKGPRGRFEGAIFEGPEEAPASWVDCPSKLIGWKAGESKVEKIDPPKKEKED